MNSSLVSWTFAATLLLLGSNVWGLLDGVPASVEAGSRLLLDPARVWDLAKAGPFELQLPIGLVAFDLQPNPLAAGAIVGENGVARGFVTETVTFEGTANGFPTRLAATQAGVFAYIDAPDAITILPQWVFDAGAPTDLHRVIRWSESPPVIPPHPEPEPVTPVTVEAIPPQVVPTGPANRVVHFLLEEDFVLYDRTSFGGQCPDCWVQVQQAILNVAEALFERQTGVHFQITSQWACTSAAACPYVGLGAGTWLEAFRDRWEARTDEPPHELGHLFSGTNLNNVAGVAFQAAVNTPNGYALSEVLAIGFDFGPVAYSTTAHEIGHNFNATHDEADVIFDPPLQILSPLRVTTMMHPSSLVKFQFSDGSLNPAHNNAARIVAHAVQQLPP